jgi:sec-independent protein translocase protein TatA
MVAAARSRPLCRGHERVGARAQHGSFGTIERMGGSLLTPLHLVLLLLVVLLLFGAKRLPEIGRSLGTGMREFKDSVTGGGNDDAEPAHSALPPPVSAVQTAATPVAPAPIAAASAPIPAAETAASAPAAVAGAEREAEPVS